MDEHPEKRDRLLGELDELRRRVARLDSAAAEHARTREELKESQRRMVTLMANLPGMAYRCRNDHDWTMEFVSEGCLALTGHAAEDLIANRLLSYAELILPEDRDEVWQRVQNALKKEIPFQVEYRIRDRDGRQRWVWEYGRGVFSAGTLEAIEGFIMDITERREAEEAIRHREAFESLLANISLRFIDLSPEQVDSGIDFALQELGRFSRTDRSYVFCFSADGATMDNTHEWCARGIEPQICNLQGVPLTELPWCMAKLSRGKVLYVPRVQDLPLAAAAEKVHWQEQGIESLVTVPIFDGGRVVGLLGFDAVARQRQWDKTDLQLLQTVGTVIGSALARRQTMLRLERALQQSREERERIDAILASVADVLIVTDVENRVLMMNRAAEELLGKALPEVLGQPVGELAPGGLANEMFEAIFSLPEGAGPADVELEVTGENTPRTYQAVTAPISGGNRGRIGSVTLLRDQTDARAVDRLKSEFISTAAHELRTPLTSVMGYAQLLLEEGGYSTEERQEFLRIIYEKGRVLEGIVDDLLDLSRVESGQVIRLQKSEWDIATLIKESLWTWRRQSQESRFILELDEDLPPLLVDRVKIEQVLNNLISNAVKFSPPGAPILVAGRRREQDVLIAVADEGRGMSREQAEKVFDKFYRVDASTTSAPGLGLGMAIAKGIVASHGGEIWVESEPGLGTIVSFTMPIPYQEGEG